MLWLLLSFATLGSSSCMRIYADPDLPDLRVEWFDSECPPGSTVDLEITKEGEASSGQVMASGPCAELRLIVADVARDRLRVTGTLREAGGALLTRASEPIDTRDGNNKQTYLMFADPDFGRYRLAWSFPPGESCESLGASYVDVVLTNEERTFSDLAPCSLGKLEYLPFVEANTYTVLVFAITASGTRLAAAPPLPDVVIARQGAISELGTVQLVPCTGPCSVPTSTATSEPAGRAR